MENEIILNEETEVVDDTTVVEDEVEVQEDDLGGENTGTTEEDSEEEGLLFTQEQVENAVRTRVNTFNRKLDKLKPYEAAVKKISEITGLDVNTLIGRLETMSDLEQAKVLGLTPEQFAAKKQAETTKKITTEKTVALERELQEQKLVSDPKYRDLPLYREEIIEVMDENPKLSMKQAYILVKGDKATEAAVRDAEQRAVAKMTKSSNQRVVKPGSTNSKAAPKIDPAVITAAKRVGMDPAEYLAFSGMSTLEDYERFNKTKKG